MLIYYVVSSLEGGGAEFAIPNIVAAIQTAGHRVRILACGMSDGMAAERLTAARIPFDLLAGEGAPRWHSTRQLLRHARAQRPTLIWTSLPKATLDGQIVGKALGIPVISWQHSAFTRRYKGWAMPLLQSLSDFWVADSATVASYLHNVMHVAQQRIFQWPLFIARPDCQQARPHIADTPFRIGSVGRLHDHKDYPTLLTAFAQMRETAPDIYARCVLTIAGTGPEEEALRAQSVNLGIADKFELVGHLDDPSDFLASLHLYTQPSRMEGMCIAAHEAMAAGLAVIATPVGELKNSIQEGRTGYFCTDSTSLAAHIVALAGNPARAHAMGCEARALMFERFSPDRFDSAALNITRSIADNRNIGREYLHSGR